MASPLPRFEALVSQPCTRAQIDSDRFAWLCTQIGELRRPDADLWSWCYVLEALSQQGVVGPGRRGLGLAVGADPIAGLLAVWGCQLVLTGPVRVEPGPDGTGLISTGPPPTEGDPRRLCDPEVWRQLVRSAQLPCPLDPVDFVWSCGALDGCAAPDEARALVWGAIGLLAPGGVVVNTLDLDSAGPMSRHRLAELIDELTGAGHQVEALFTSDDLVTTGPTIRFGLIIGRSEEP